MITLKEVLSRPLESKFFLNRILLWTNRPFVHTKPVNPLTETASFWNRSPEFRSLQSGLRSRPPESR